VWQGNEKEETDEINIEEALLGFGQRKDDQGLACDQVRAERRKTLTPRHRKARLTEAGEAY
jgi:hypothetical protein